MHDEDVRKGVARPAAAISPAIDVVDTATVAPTWTPRLTVVFDREGYSPQLFAERKARGIALFTYRKFPGQPWPESEFVAHSVRRHSGEGLPAPSLRA